MRYLIATDDGSNPDYETAREAGLRAASEAGASVVLYDRSGESSMTDPYPVGPWSDSDDAVSADSHLEPDVLAGLGRQYLADQVIAAREAGLEAEAHLGQGSGAEAIARAVERFGADVVVLPASECDSSLLDKFKHDTVDQLKEEVSARICAVEADGTLHEV